MGAKTFYARQLRGIGQSLEAQRIEVFELTYQERRYTVRGAPEKETSLLAALRHWQKQLRNQGMTAALTYTDQDLAELDQQGSARRSQSHRLPDFHSLPNTLRTVGGYLEGKNAELIKLNKKQLSITILSRNQAGYPELEERSLGSLYEVFLRSHAQRNSTPGR